MSFTFVESVCDGIGAIKVFGAMLSFVSLRVNFQISICFTFGTPEHPLCVVGYEQGRFFSLSKTSLISVFEVLEFENCNSVRLSALNLLRSGVLC